MEELPYVQLPNVDSPYFPFFFVRFASLCFKFLFFRDPDPPRFIAASLDAARPVCMLN